MIWPILYLAAMAALTSCSETAPEDTLPDDTLSMTPISCNGLDTCVHAANDLTAAERLMSRELEGANERLANCAPANSTRCYNIDQVAALIDLEQRTWLAWRDAHCDVFTFSMKDTSAEGELRAVCRTEVTRERTAELTRILST